MKKKQYAFYINSAACSGCKACQIACKDKNDLDVGIIWRRVYEVTGGDWVEINGTYIPEIFSYNLSISCNHCEDPKCVNACPTKALTKRKDGIVYIREDVCMGCRYCEWACPYGAPQFNPVKGIMTKCNFCYDEIDLGHSPACVAACPMRVIEFGEIEELTKKYGNSENIYPMPEKDITKPSLVLNPHAKAKLASDENAEISNREEL